MIVPLNRIPITPALIISLPGSLTPSQSLAILRSADMKVRKETDNKRNSRLSISSDAIWFGVISSCFRLGVAVRSPYRRYIVIPLTHHKHAHNIHLETKTWFHKSQPFSLYCSRFTSGSFSSPLRSAPLLSPSFASLALLSQPLTSRCLFNASLREKLLLQKVQGKGFTARWILLCRFRSWLRLND